MDHIIASDLFNKWFQSGIPGLALKNYHNVPIIVALNNGQKDGCITCEVLLKCLNPYGKQRNKATNASNARYDKCMR